MEVILALITSDPVLLGLVEKLGKYAIDQMVVPMAEKIASLVVMEFFKKADDPEFIKKWQAINLAAATSKTEEDKNANQDAITSAVNSPIK